MNKRWLLYPAIGFLFIIGILRIQYWPFIDYRVFHNWNEPRNVTAYILYGYRANGRRTIISTRHPPHMVVNPIRLNRLTLYWLLQNNRQPIDDFLRKSVEVVDTQHLKYGLLSQFNQLRLIQTGYTYSNGNWRPLEKTAFIYRLEQTAEKKFSLTYEKTEKHENLEE